MATEDKCVSIVPYFKVHSGKMDAFRGLCEQFVEKSRPEPKCLYYGLVGKPYELWLKLHGETSSRFFWTFQVNGMSTYNGQTV